MPVGVETTIDEITSSTSDSDSDFSAAGYAEADLTPLDGSSDLIHLSGLLPLTQPLPSPTTSATDLAPYLNQRRARIRLNASVTSLDGVTHVVYEAPTTIVSSWRGAEAWGEACARELRDRGAGKVLDVINAERRERELADLESKKAVASAKANGQEAVNGTSA